ncbi:MAG: hypothetical protein IKI63_06425 [Clostridia bacterium]|nr:hypothetical protein [Clostridia bacterium]
MKELINQNRTPEIIRKYFSDFYKWNAIVLFLFLVSYLCSLIWGGEWGRYWSIPVIFLLIVLTATRYYTLYFTAIRDIKKSRIEIKNVCVQSIVSDKKCNTYSKSGVVIGKEKCILVDSEGQSYRVLVDGDWIVEMRAADYYLGAKAELQHLAHSRIVLHMKRLSSDAATQHLYEDFSLYY